ncbi:nad mitochondrial precursor [Pyrenophora seminiperda CCB06]|uniref:Nad mitochondrial n=1 Tax=Pyrenophora seminiperda CCB06 TaxID=1302712 RepID=A0A3M7M555_9PLEO|nr:nad mitochondrial precursor [Pyrenophora seminiperda CCB06]
MRSFIIIGAAALAAASPAPQAIDINQLNAIVNNVPKGPAMGVVSQEAYHQADAQKKAAAAAVNVATAKQAKRDAAANLESRSPTFWGMWGFPSGGYGSSSGGYGSGSTGGNSNPTYGNTPSNGNGGYGAGSGPAPAPAPGPGPAPTQGPGYGYGSGNSTAPSNTVVVPVQTPSPTAPATTAPATTHTFSSGESTNLAPSSCTPVSWTNTFAFTSAPACATAIEVGTYCGFINPEDPCAAQPNAYGPPTTPDTADAFKNNAVYHKLATSAKTPSGYDQAFSDLSASVSGSGYLGYYELTSYDTDACAAKCESTATCTGFDLFIERDPKWNPRQCSCTKPDSVTRFKCTLWGQDVTKESATNNGQDQDGFEVVIVGSNGYNKKTYTPPTPPSCSKPQSCGHKLHNQQPYCMGQSTFPGPFDPSLCAAYAQKQNSVNRKGGIIGSFLSMFGMNKGGCVQFQAAYLEKDGVGFGTHCRLFTKKFAAAQANLEINTGGWGCQKSYTFDLDVNASFNWGKK